MKTARRLLTIILIVAFVFACIPATAVNGISEMIAQARELESTKVFDIDEGEPVSSNEVIPLSDELVDLMMRLDQYDSFTLEEKELIHNHFVNAKEENTDEPVETIIPQKQKSSPDFGDLDRLYDVLGTRVDFDACSEDEKNTIREFIKVLPESNIVRLCEEGYTLRQVYHISLIIEGNFFTEKEAKEIIKKYPSIIEWLGQVSTLKRFLSKEAEIDKKHKAKELFLKGYSADSIVTSFALEEILGLGQSETILTFEEHINLMEKFINDASKSVSGKVTYEQLSISFAFQLDVVKKAAEEKNLSPEDLICELMKYVFVNIDNEIDLDGEIQAEPEDMPKALNGGDQHELVDYEKTITAPFKSNTNQNESIGLNTGDLNLSFDIVDIPGVNGNTLDLNITYNSNDAELSKRKLGYSYYTMYYAEGYREEYWYLNGGLYTKNLPVKLYFNTVNERDAWMSNNNRIYRTFNLPPEDCYVDFYYATARWRNDQTATGLTNPWEQTGYTGNPAPDSVYVNTGVYMGSIPRTGTELIRDDGYVYSPSQYPNRQIWTHHSIWDAIYSGYISGLIKSYLYTYSMSTTGLEHFPYNYNTTEPVTYTERNNLGAGWSWNLPSIEFDGSTKVLHLGDGTSFLVNSNLSLKDYSLTDIQLQSDSASYNNGQVNSAYVLKYKDGSKYYFASDGRLISQMDRYGNTTEYQHITINGYPVLNKIIDTAGRETSIAYNTTSSGKEIVITAPDSTQTKLVLEPIPNYSSDYVLKRIEHPNQTQTSFSYSYNTAYFNFLSKNPLDTINVCANLTEVIYPTNAKSQYSYVKKTENLGSSGSYETYKVSSRKDVEAVSEYNNRSYTYGSHSGFGQYSDPNNLPSSYTYSTTVTDQLGRVSTYTFNHKHLNTNETMSNGSSNLYSKSVTYNTDKLPINITERDYNLSGAYMERVLLYEYDNKGNITASWDEQALGVDTDTDHKTVYTYDPEYSIPLTTTYKTNANTTILKQNTLTANGKSIQYSEVFENGTLKQKSEYQYDSFGNVTKERKYKDDFTSYIEKHYSYTDNVAGRSLHGAYLTEVMMSGVTDEAGNLVAGTPGYAAGVIASLNYYDVMGRITSQIDARGNSTSYQYDASGRIIRITHPDSTYIDYDYNYTSNYLIHTNEIGVQTKYVYDGFGNEIAVIDLNANQPIKTTVYDQYFRVVKVHNHNNSTDSSEVNYTYDLKDRPTSIITKNKAGIIMAEETYTYDEAVGNGLSKVTKTIVGDSNAPSIVSTSYTDRSGRLVKQGRIYNSTEYCIWIQAAGLPFLRQ
ncbi:MAG: RHS repeat domain-containing protein [Eubacteriales bacterium]